MVRFVDRTIPDAHDRVAMLLSDKEENRRFSHAHMNQPPETDKKGIENRTQLDAQEDRDHKDSRGETSS
jgi:hypothetical protein